MFAGFSEKTGAFLWDLAFNNERPWFLAHKQEFEDFVNTPFKALAQDCYQLMRKRAPAFEAKVHISRIYRDARRLFGRGPYKDHLWFTLEDSCGRGDGPAFWFELGPSDYSYGMGFYEATPRQMEQFRRSVDANLPRFRRLIEGVSRGGWTMDGEPYKRPKALHDDALLDSWYNRKRVGLERCFDLGGPAYTASLPGILVDAYTELMPMYQYLMEVYLSCPEEMGRSR